MNPTTILTPEDVFLYPCSDFPTTLESPHPRGYDVSLTRDGPVVFSVRRGPLGWSHSLDTMCGMTGHHSEHRAIQVGLAALARMEETA